MNIRPPAVAGLFYPDDPQALDRMVREMLAEAPAGNEVPKAIIVPHAGYVYSGPVAATAYARLKQARECIDRVVLLGPVHRVPIRGLAASSADAFLTPLGNVLLDRDSIERLAELPQVEIRDDAHAQEHSLEVHLPFLQEVLDDFRLVPLAVGDARCEEVEEVLDIAWGGPETLIVVSSDLSHYHDYETAHAMDKATSMAIEALSPESIGYDQACGRTPVCGLLLAARKRGMHARTIDLRNSGDTAGPRDQVVGYGAYVLH